MTTAVSVAISWDRIGPERSDAPRFFLNSFEVKSTMGMIDQRGEWRQVVTDGLRQAQVQGPGQDEQPVSVEERGSTAMSEQRGIRLLPESGAGRTPGRGGTLAGRALEEGEDQDQGPDPVASPIEDQGQVERPRRLRSDEAHPPRPVEPYNALTRLRGPLSVRIAQRHQRGTPGTIAIGNRSSASPTTTAGDDHATGDVSGS